MHLDLNESFNTPFLRLFDPFEKNINFFFEQVCDNKALTKIMDNIPLPQLEATSQSELLQMKNNLKQTPRNTMRG